MKVKIRQKEKGAAPQYYCNLSKTTYEKEVDISLDIDAYGSTQEECIENLKIGLLKVIGVVEGINFDEIEFVNTKGEKI